MIYQDNNVAECGIWTNEKNIIIVLSYNASLDWRKQIETRDIEMHFVPIKRSHLRSLLHKYYNLYTIYYEREVILDGGKNVMSCFNDF